MPELHTAQPLDYLSHVTSLVPDVSKVADIHIPPTSPDVTDLAKSGRIGVRNTLEAFYHTDESEIGKSAPNKL